ncbi:hypothetical protein M0805_005150 [Coniferiporia weirii]|nr:hypothetical protein M0805_005150 [Coniferiporia weirii]
MARGMLGSRRESPTPVSGRASRRCEPRVALGIAEKSAKNKSPSVETLSTSPSTPGSTTNGRGLNPKPVSFRLWARLSMSPEPPSRLNTALARAAGSVEGYASEGGRSRGYLGLKRNTIREESDDASHQGYGPRAEVLNEEMGVEGEGFFQMPLASAKQLSDERRISIDTDLRQSPTNTLSAGAKRHQRLFSPASESSLLTSTRTRSTDSSDPAKPYRARPPRNPARESDGQREMKIRRPSTASGVLESGSSRDTNPTRAQKASRQPGPDAFQSKAKPSSGKDNADKARFSTTDRTILAELKHSLSVRESKFVVKNGKKHHPYSEKEVPFPRNYERLVLDHEVWGTLFYQQLIGGVCFHPFETPPAKALDLGCGTGSWILHTARVWKQTHFVGLDIVPLHPDLTRVGSTDLANRVSWIQANFLEKLPFPDDEFDFVMIKRISRAVPEDKFDALFEEVARVMKPGGAIEIVEEDLYFPGSVSDPVILALGPSGFGDDGSSTSVDLRHSSSSASHYSGESQKQADSTRTTLSSSSTHSPTAQRSGSIDQFRINLEQTLGSLGPSLSSIEFAIGQIGLDTPGTSSNQSKETRRSEGERSSEDQHLKTTLQHLNTSAPLSDSTHLFPSQTGSRKRSLSNARVGKILSGLEEPPTPSQASHSLLNRRKSKSKPRRSDPAPRSHDHSGDFDASLKAGPSQESLERLAAAEPASMALPLVPGWGGFTLVNISGPSHESSASLSDAEKRGSGDKDVKSSISTGEEKAHSGEGSSAKDEPRKSTGLYHPSQSQPLDPRDHSLLERIYREMHADRFINLTPLSLLTAQLDLYFSRVKSHAPISFAFPPKPQKPGPPDGADTWSDDEDDPLLGLPDGSESEDTSIVHYHHNTIIPAKPRRKRRRSSARSSLSRGDELATQYVLVDKTRMPAVLTRRRTKTHVYADSVHSAASSSETVVNGPARSTQPSSLSRSFTAASEADTSADMFTSATAPAPASPASPQHAKPLEIDLRSLHLHLATRVAETVACAEAMWEWVLTEKERYAAEQTREETFGRRAIQRPEDEQLKAIRELTRADFDSCLSRFEMDMHDNIALDHALEKYLGMKPGLVPSRSAERKSFKSACAAWDADHAPERGPANTQVGAVVELMPGRIVGGGARTQSDVGRDGKGAAALDPYANQVRLSRSIRIFMASKAR